MRSKSFKIWLGFRFYLEHAQAPGSQAVEDALRVLEGRAVHEGPEYPVFMRVGELYGRTYVDLADAAWRAVEIAADDWRVVDRARVKFIRSKGMLPLPAPEHGEAVDRLRPFLNYGSDENFTTIVAWLVAALWASGPYPILAVNGEQGSAKSSLTRMLRALVDPNSAPIRSAPRDEHNLMVVAKNSWILALDNISEMHSWLSDALCRLATGGGFSTRELYSDWDEALLHAQRPIIINGIPSLASRPDLADRTISLTLPAIRDAERRSERELGQAFEAARPEIFGALLDGVAAALHNLDTTRPAKSRMADFEVRINAAEPGLGWAPGTFDKAYEDNRRHAVATTLEADPLAAAIIDLRDHIARYGFRLGDSRIYDRCEGSATDVLATLEEVAKANARDAVTKSKHWPTRQSLRNRLRQLQAPLRRQESIELGLDHRSSDSQRTRLIVIAWPKRD